jgi:ribosomal protein S18 acetylase RimI-like enzyme
LNLLPSIVSSEDELLQIHALNKRNLRSAINAAEQKSNGFVTWLYSLELLKKMHAVAPSVIIKDGNKIAGYALVALKEMSPFHADLQTLFTHILQFRYEDKPLSHFKFYCMGQICIDINYRGMGLVDMLYQKHKEIYSDRYQLLITEISTSNIRSQKAHEKSGFKTIHSYRDALDEWNVVAWDWR